VQGWPSTKGPQRPFTQATPSLHSAFVVHLELHTPLTHRKPPQYWTSGAWQVPNPSQVRGAFAEFVVRHVAAPHGVPDG
jgi:hypothetical protein